MEKIFKISTTVKLLPKTSKYLKELKNITGLSGSSQIDLMVEAEYERVMNNLKTKEDEK